MKRMDKDGLYHLMHEVLTPYNYLYTYIHSYTSHDRP